MSTAFRSRMRPPGNITRECKYVTKVSSNKKIKKPIESHSIQMLSNVDQYILFATISITGAVVMMVEILGTRIISPYYGVSLIIWSSLISVTLMALAMGYFFGGKLADGENIIQLSQIIFGSAIFTGLIPLISEPVQASFEVFGLRGGALASAMILFGPPLTLLGMVGPFVIKLLAFRLEKVGSTSGNVYAISTCGSVIGTLFLGFYLIPVAGTRLIVVVLSIVLFLLGICLVMLERKWRKDSNKNLTVVIISVAILVMILAVGQYKRSKEYSGYNVVSEAESHYGWVRVVDQPKQRIRWLMSDSSTIGAEDLDTGKSRLGYQQIVSFIPRFNPRGEEALLIGLGSGHLVNALKIQGVSTDAIEIDPAVAKAAKDYFSFRASGQVLVGDARYQVKNLAKNYDFIIHDCFTGGSEPIHLLSIEMLQSLRLRLKDRGVLALNFVGFTQGEHRKTVNAVARTLSEIFPYQRTFLSAPGEKFNDFVFFASNYPIGLGSGYRDKQLAHWMEQREIVISGEDSFVITDDFNPLESMQIAKAELYREMLKQRVGEEILFW